MKKRGIKLSALAVAGLLTFTSSYTIASEANFARAHKELKIMSNIFETSLKEQTSKNAKILGSKRSEATYLAKQGMLFTFSFARTSFGSEQDWESFGEGIGHFVGAIASEVGSALAEYPEMPEPPEPPQMEFEEHFEAYQERIESLESMRDEQRHQREQVRELQREIRSLERQNSKDDNQKKELDKAKKQLEDKMQVLNKRMDEYKKSMQEYRENRDRKFTESAQLKSSTIISTLCDYGATMRSLDKGEYITLIFKNFANQKDQVYVFDFNDVKDCTSKDKLLKSAISYQI